MVNLNLVSSRKIFFQATPPLSMNTSLGIVHILISSTTVICKIRCLRLLGTSTATNLKKWINQWMDALRPSDWPNWVLSNHDQARLSSKLGDSEFVDVANMLLLLLPGTATCYFGDELALNSIKVRSKESRKPISTLSTDNFTRMMNFFSPTKNHDSIKPTGFVPVCWGRINNRSLV